MSDYNSMTLRDFIEFKGGDKIINGFGGADIFIYDKSNKSVAACIVSPKDRQWSLDSLLSKGSKSGDLVYHVYLEPNENNQFYIYPLEVAFTGLDLI
ncbi:MAG: hypothetical protein EOO43_16510 [Flavobacterium sp.]|nr:MAG: hypothetical protein EOO43_16510 [Flavobacterium sp.]